MALAAIAALALGSTRFNAGPRRFMMESLGFAILAGILPGLVLQIRGGDAYFFLIFSDWLSVPVLVFLLADLPLFLPAARRGSARLVVALAALGLVGILVQVVLAAPLQFSLAVSQAALLHTGDRGFYSNESRRAWRDDARRAEDRYGLLGLYRLPPPEPVGSGLAAALIAEKSELGGSVAAYIPPESDYWSLVLDCGGRSTWPMAVAGVPLIDGYVPIQADCPEKFVLNGYRDVPAIRSVLSDQALCARAKGAGFTTVLVVTALADRARDRRLACQ
jgi:hypothetical protein